MHGSLTKTLVSAVCLTLVALLLAISPASTSEQDGRPVVHLVAMESTGIQDGGATYYVRHLKPLLEIALEDAEDRFGRYLDIRFKHIETLCGPSEIGALAAREYYKSEVDVFFGPGRHGIVLNCEVRVRMFIGSGFLCLYFI